MTLTDWAPPVIAFAALCMSMSAPHARDRNMLLLHAGSNYAWGVYMILFDAITAMAISVVAGTSMVVSAFTPHLSDSAQRKVRWTFMSLNIIVLLATWQGLQSLLPFIAVTIGTYSSFFLRYERLRVGIAACILMWGFNALYWRAWEGVASCLLQFGSQLVGMKKARLERLRDTRRNRHQKAGA